MKAFLKDPVPIVFCTALVAEFIRGLQAFAPNQFASLQDIVQSFISQIG